MTEREPTTEEIARAMECRSGDAWCQRSARRLRELEADAKTYLTAAQAFRAERNDLATKSSHLLSENERLHRVSRELEAEVAHLRRCSAAASDTWWGDQHELVAGLRAEAEQWKATAQDEATGNHDHFARCQELEAEIARLEPQTRILRGLVQTNPEWKCPHGYDVPTMGHCPAGFPGCACADDRIAVLCEDETRVVSGLRAEVARLRVLLQNGEEVIENYTAEHCLDTVCSPCLSMAARSMRHALEAELDAGA